MTERPASPDIDELRKMANELTDQHEARVRNLDGIGAHAIAGAINEVSEVTVKTATPTHWEPGILGKVVGPPNRPGPYFQPRPLIPNRPPQQNLPAQG